MPSRRDGCVLRPRDLQALLMRVGDLVKLEDVGYPQYRGKLGVLVERRYTGRWIVMIGSVLHPYVVDETDMELINENR